MIEASSSFKKVNMTSTLLVMSYLLRIFFCPLFVYAFALSPSASFASEAKTFPVTFEGESLFSLSVDLPSNPAQMRAKEATKLLAHAIEAKDVDKSIPLVSVENDDDHFRLYIRGILIASIYREDANAMNDKELVEYADLIHARMTTLVEGELKRQYWQDVALKFFVSVILLVLGFYVLRQLKVAFDRLEDILVERQEIVKKFKIFGVPLLKRESAAGLLVFLSEVARWLAYLAVIAIILLSMLGQFAVTKELLKTVGRDALLDLAHLVQEVTRSIPGVFLALLILLALHIAIHALNLMLDGFKAQKLEGRIVKAHRVPVLKTVAPALLLAIFVPLAVASFFHQWHTPTEWLLVGASLVIVLGALPLIATWLCGSLVLWRNELKEGTWVSINGVVGEISSINTIFLHLVPLGGGVVTMPMLKVFLSPIKKFSSAPKESVHIEIASVSTYEETVQMLKESLAELVDGVEVEPIAIEQENLKLIVKFRYSSKEMKSKVMLRTLHLCNRLGNAKAKVSAHD